MVFKCTLFLLLCCVHGARGFVSHSPNCTIPEPGTNYVAAGNVRSTLDILWTSLATIIACTYSVLHLNVPLQRDGRDPGWRGDLAWGWGGLRKKMKYCIITIFAPEYYLVGALVEYRSARFLRRKLSNLGPDIHGGRGWSLRECFYITMGGYAISQRGDSEHRGIVHLWPESFIHLLKQDPANVLPQLLTNEEIADRSKSDMFTKTVILVQVCYFCITLFTRWAKRIPVTPLEVATIAYTTCSIFTYGLFLYKPQGATVVKMVAHYDTKLPEPLSLVLGAELTTNRTSILQPISNNDSDHIPKLSTVPILALTSALFGAVHLAAWDSTFPSTIERWIWRVAAMISMVALIPLWPLSFLPDSGAFVVSLMLFGPICIYALARLVLIVEMFRSLAYLPPEAFIATWTTNVPHFG
ncbi:hypothetical protein B0A48_10801 [Cryoendolithus antarcticus]|uniref:Uncharacterized protein n=1 Tax=Cryoendolithus antarcticus TaxID=1507870 RepID=A0A1V8SYU8_9PEZI|nr:hypothetical protein B0A48_10801 [Cryoendolithus antarcticus]